MDINERQGVVPVCGMATSLFAIRTIMMKHLLELIPVLFLSRDLVKSLCSRPIALLHKFCRQSPSKDVWGWVLRFAVLVLLCSPNASLHAQVKLASVFSDNMVLQQNQQVKIWGTAPAGHPVTVTASWNETVSTKTNDKGQWEARLTTPRAGANSYELSVVSNKNTVTLKNVVTGEV